LLRAPTVHPQDVPRGPPQAQLAGRKIASDGEARILALGRDLERRRRRPATAGRRSQATSLSPCRGAAARTMELISMGAALRYSVASRTRDSSTANNQAWTLITSPDERYRCCVVLAGARCERPSAFRVAGPDSDFDDYAYVCMLDLELVRGPGDDITPVKA
jgi:hypothetical protein